MMIGLTGQTGAGKSTVAAMLRENGIPVIDADQVTRELQQAGSPVLQRLAEAFSPEILREDGSLDRAKLASIAFGDPEQLAKLNALMHPPILERIQEKYQQLMEAKPLAVVVDAPMLFESELADQCRRVVAVVADEEIRIARIVSRDGLTREAALQRIRAQRDKAFFMLHADYVLENTGDLDHLRWEAERLISFLKEQGRAKS